MWKVNGCQYKGDQQVYVQPEKILSQYKGDQPASLPKNWRKKNAK